MVDKIIPMARDYKNREEIMALIDVKEVEATAKKEIAEEVKKTAVGKLKELYGRREKAQLALRNIEREINSYLADVADLAVYETAGVDTTSDK